MNKNQAENLRVLILHMENNVTRTLDMGKYFNLCGTPACALGEAAFAPDLAHLGMSRNTPYLMSTYGHLFVPADLTMTRLFGVHYVNAWGRADVTPQEWAIEARKVLAEHGYSMDTDKAAADAFINRIRKWEPERIGKDTIRFDLRDRV